MTFSVVTRGNDAPFKVVTKSKDTGDDEVEHMKTSLIITMSAASITVFERTTDFLYKTTTHSPPLNPDSSSPQEVFRYRISTGWFVRKPSVDELKNLVLDIVVISA